MRPLLLLASLLVLAGCQTALPVASQERKAVEREDHGHIWFVKNQRIELYVAQYRKTGRVVQLRRKASPYMDHIFKVFRQYDLPIELGFLPMVESSFDPLAKSARAAGLWQLTRSTAWEMGLRVDERNDERLDWRKCTVAAAKYIKKLEAEYDGNWGLVLAAYNAGPGAIHDAVEFQGSTDFWHLTLRDETMNYVPRFIAMIHLLREDG